MKREEKRESFCQLLLFFIVSQPNNDHFNDSLSNNGERDLLYIRFVQVTRLNRVGSLRSGSI